MATVVADDPVFGRICLGGTIADDAAGVRVVPADGVRRRLHLRLDGASCDVRLLNARFAAARPVAIAPDAGTIGFEAEMFDPRADVVALEVRWGDGDWRRRDVARRGGGIVLHRDG